MTRVAPRTSRIVRAAALISAMAFVAPTTAPRVALYAQSAQSAQGVAPDSFVVQRIADGMYAFVRREPPAMALNSNSVAIVTDSDVIVVDAEFTAAAARGVIAALRHITSKPVTYVVNTHWHDDHTAGDRAYLDAYPNAHVIAQVNTASAMRTIAVANRTVQLEQGPAAVARIRHLVTVDSTLAGGRLSAPERASYLTTIALFDEYVHEAPTFRAVFPDVTFDDTLTLVRTFAGRARTIELHYYGRGNTEGDAVVFLPRERILVAGDLVVAPVPLCFNSHPREWIAALNRLLALRPAVIVPGHGPVMTDVTYMTRVRDLLVAAVAATDSARARGLTLVQTHAAVQLASFRTTFAGSDPLVNSLWNSWTLQPLVSAAYTDTLLVPLARPTGRR